MNNKYLRIKKKYFVKNELTAVLLFYDYFLFRPRIPFSLRKILKYTNYLGRLIIKIIYKCKIINLFNSTCLPTKFIIQRTGVGDRPNLVKLLRNNGNYVIYKEFHDPIKKRNELLFLKTYSSNLSYTTDFIKLPKFTISNNRIYYEFFKTKNFATNIREGKYSKQEILLITKKLLVELDKFYSHKNDTLIHGDLNPDNLYFIDNIFYLIDFSDSEFYYTGYDQYIFFKRILDEVKFNSGEAIISSYFNQAEVKRYECHLEVKSKIKFKQTNH